MIVIWSGAVVDIPHGWHICDGTEGTPDLQFRFVLGAGQALAPGTIGGDASHDHDFTGDGHSHTMPAGTGIAAGTDIATTSTIVPATGTTDTKPNFPPFHALAYIMKL